MRNNEKITCAVIEDLLPGYSENLCSDETKALIKSHLSECERCTAMLNALPIPEKKNTEIPPEKRAFVKVNRKLKTRLAINTVLGAIILIALIIMGVLASGEVSGEGMSFTKLQFASQVKQIGKDLTEGDYEQLFMRIGTQNLGVVPTDGQEDYDRYTEYMQTLFKERYEAAYGGAKVKSVRVKDIDKFWIAGASGEQLAGLLEIQYDGKPTLELCAVAQSAGSYYLMPWSGKFYDWEDTGDSPEEAFACAVDFYSTQHMTEISAQARALITNEPLTKPFADVRKHMAAITFEPDSRERVAAQIAKFYDGTGFAVTDCTFSELRWDDDRKTLYLMMTLTAKDSEGSAVMTVRIDNGADGWVVPEPGAGEVWEKDCTPALTAALQHFFA